MSRGDPAWPGCSVISLAAARRGTHVPWARRRQGHADSIRAEPTRRQSPLKRAASLKRIEPRRSRMLLRLHELCEPQGILQVPLVGASAASAVHITHRRTCACFARDLGHQSTVLCRSARAGTSPSGDQKRHHGEQPKHHEVRRSGHGISARHGLANGETPNRHIQPSKSHPNPTKAFDNNWY